MKIPLFDRLFRKSEPSESVPVKEEQNQKPVRMGIAQARDVFEPASKDSLLPNSLARSNLKQAEAGSVDESDDVLANFQSGEARTPYAVGSLWNSKDTPPTTAKSDSDSDSDRKRRLKPH
jgi:hypothetical protein